MIYETWGIITLLLIIVNIISNETLPEPSGVTKYQKIVDGVSNIPIGSAIFYGIFLSCGINVKSLGWFYIFTMVVSLILIGIFYSPGGVTKKTIFEKFAFIVAVISFFAFTCIDLKLLI